MSLLLFYLFVALFFSFLCSILEAVLLSITPSYIGVKKQEGNSSGTDLQALKDEIDRPLAAILTLNTFAHTIGAAGVGAQAQAIWGEEYLTIISAVLTILILFLSEIIPKTLGANYWKQLAPLTAKVLKWLILLLYPFVWVSQIITKVLKKDKGKSVLSRADFSAMAEIGLKEGVFEQQESTIIQNLLKFNSVRAEDIMTPRNVMLAAPEGKSIKRFYEENKGLRFSRVPIYKEDKDSIHGYILKDELLLSMINQKGEDPLLNIKRNIIVVNEDMPIPDLFNELNKQKEHIALVTDRYGGVSGIVTMEDIIETLLGTEIMDELDNIADLQAYARKNWKERAAKLGLIEPDLQ